MERVNADNGREAMEFDVVNDGPTAVVTISGELDIANIEELETAVEPVIVGKPDRLVIDVGGLRFADSSAIALWVRWAAAVGEIELRDVSPLSASGHQLDGTRAETAVDDMTESRSFPRRPESVAAARRFAKQALRGMASDVLDSVELMVSELATNCVRHTNTAFDLTIARVQDRIRVEVTDRAGGTPTMRSPGPEDPTGRGLQIVNLLSDTWGVEPSSTSGKTVWFTVNAVAAPVRA